MQELWLFGGSWLKKEFPAGLVSFSMEAEQSKLRSEKFSMLPNEELKPSTLNLWKKDSSFKHMNPPTQSRWT